MSLKIGFEWERIDTGLAVVRPGVTYRAKVIGGWLVRYSSWIERGTWIERGNGVGSEPVSDSMVFIQDWSHLWVIDKASEPTVDLTDNLDMPIEELELTPRAERCLRSENIRTVRDLIRYSLNDLLKTPNLGRKSIKDITDKIEARGLKLREGSIIV